MNFTYASIKYLTVDEFNELIEKIPEADPSSKFMKRNLTIFLVAEYCALRASEIGAIRFTDYDPKNNTLICRRLKGSMVILFLLLSQNGQLIVGLYIH